MKKVLKTRKITDGVEILDRRYIRNNPEMKKMVEEEFEKLQIGQQIYDLRKEANLTQDELADMVGTTGSVISRLESAEYDYKLFEPTNFWQIFDCTLVLLILAPFRALVGVLFGNVR